MLWHAKVSGLMNKLFSTMSLRPEFRRDLLSVDLQVVGARTREAKFHLTHCHREVVIIRSGREGATPGRKRVSSHVQERQ